MKLKRLSSLLFAALFSAAAFGAPYTWKDPENVTWSFMYDASTYRATITDTDQGAGYLVVPKHVMHDSTELTVTAVAIEAFKNKALLKSVRVEVNGPMSIGDEAMYGCDDLEEFVLAASSSTIGNNVFSWDLKLSKVSLGEGLVAIGDYAFWHCKSLKTLRIPSTVTQVSNLAFSDMDGTVTVEAPISLKGTLYSAQVGTTDLVVTYYGEEPTAPESTAGATARSLYDAGVAGYIDLSAASTWNGYLKDALGGIAGSVQLTVGKANGRTGLAKVSGTIVHGATKIKAQGEVGPDGVLSATCKDGSKLNLTLTAGGMTGTWKGLAVDGVVNIFKLKTPAAKAQAWQMLRTCSGTYCVAWPQDGAWAGGSFKVSSGGKVQFSGVKCQGNAATGTKMQTFSASGQLCLGKDGICATIASTRKNVQLVFNVWFAQGALEVEGLAGAKAGVKGPLASASAMIDNEILAAECKSALTGGGMTVVPTLVVRGDKWTIAPEKNILALKIKFTPKSGSFKGSFKRVLAYTNTKKTVTLAGVVVGGVGYGFACGPGLAATPVVIQ